MGGRDNIYDPLTGELRQSKYYKSDDDFLKNKVSTILSKENPTIDDLLGFLRNPFNEDQKSSRYIGGIDPFKIDDDDLPF